MNLHGDSVVEQWSVLVPGAAGECPGVLAAVEATLVGAAVPSLRWSQESVSTSLSKSLGGQRRDALVIRLRPYAEWLVCVFAQPFGAYLHVAWNVVATPRLSREVVRAIRFGGERERRRELGAELDSFGLMELAAYLALTLYATKAAVESLGLEAIPVGFISSDPEDDEAYTEEAP